MNELRHKPKVKPKPTPVIEGQLRGWLGKKTVIQIVNLLRRNK